MAILVEMAEKNAFEHIVLFGSLDQASLRDSPARRLAPNLPHSLVTFSTRLRDWHRRWPRTVPLQRGQQRCLREHFPVSSL
jgi:hypothetical protein